MCAHTKSPLISTTRLYVHAHTHKVYTCIYKLSSPTVVVVVVVVVVFYAKCLPTKRGRRRFAKVISPVLRKSLLTPIPTPFQPFFAPPPPLTVLEGSAVYIVIYIYTYILSSLLSAFSFAFSPFRLPLLPPPPPYKTRSIRQTHVVVAMVYNACVYVSSKIFFSFFTRLRMPT